MSIVKTDLLKMSIIFFFSSNTWDAIRHPFIDKCKEVCPGFGDLDEVEKFRFVMNDELIQLLTAEYVCTAFF